MVEGPWGSLTQQSSLSEANSCQFPNTPTTVYSIPAGKDHLQEHHGQARQKLPQEVKVKEGGNLLNIWLNKTSMHIMHDLDTKINRNGLVRAFCLLQNLCQIPFHPALSMWLCKYSYYFLVAVQLSFLYLSKAKITVYSLPCLRL